MLPAALSFGENHFSNHYTYTKDKSSPFKSLCVRVLTHQTFVQTAYIFSGAEKINHPKRHYPNKKIHGVPFQLSG